MPSLFEGRLIRLGPTPEAPRNTPMCHPTFGIVARNLPEGSFRRFEGKRVQQCYSALKILLDGVRAGDREVNSSQLQLIKIVFGMAFLAEGVNARAKENNK